LATVHAHDTVTTNDVTTQPTSISASFTTIVVVSSEFLLVSEDGGVCNLGYHR